MRTFETITEAIQVLRSEGYTEDFNLKTTFLECRNGVIQVNPDQLKIDQVCRFEGNTDPDDEMILYAISSDQYNIKGLLVNAYGAYSDTLSEELARKLTFRDKAQEPD